MTQSEIEQKALDHINSTYSTSNDRIDRLRSYLAGYNASSLDSQNQIDKLTECLREAVPYIEYLILGLPTGDARNKAADFNIKLQSLLATFTDKKS